MSSFPPLPSEPMQLVEITNEIKPQHPDISERFSNSSRTQYTRHYLLVDESTEVGFVSLDHWPDSEFMVLYELFVPEQLRRRGIGTRGLRIVEELARALGYAKLRLIPEPLDGSLSKLDLQNWYSRQGFFERADCPKEFEKQLI